MNTSPKQSHDPLFKELIQSYFKDFMEFAFIEVHEWIDYDKIKFIDKEILDTVEGIERRVDILVEANIKGEDEIIFIHIEVEASPKQNFAFRMWEYYALIHRNFKKPVVPIVIFLDNKKNEDLYKNTYQVSFREFTFLSFTFHKLKLKEFDVQKYLNFDNPVVQVLLTQMNLNNVDAKKIKIEILRYIYGKKTRVGKFTPLLYNFVQTYMPLPKNDEIEIEKKIIQEFSKEDSQMKTYFEILSEKRETEGIIKGKIEGKIEGRMDTLLNNLEEYKSMLTLGEISENTYLQKIETQKEIEAPKKNSY